jgi:hypothetical protein
MIVGFTPYFGGADQTPQGHLIRILRIESLFVPAVNCFVLISGYFFH